MAELASLLTTEIPEGRTSLLDSHSNLEKVAEYCEGNYFQADNKRMALEETKNYTTQSLASVAYQINTLAYNFLQLLDLQTAQLEEMESQMNHIGQTVSIHKEKVARREIGVLTANKTTNRQYKIIAPANPEKPIKYVRKPIDLNALDEIGHGVRNTPRGKQSQRTPSQSNISIIPGPPAPTTKPPTPPSIIRGTGTLNKNSREYRTPPAVAPPQVPSHYAPNYPIGHPKRERGPGYGTLPQVGMVHPLPPPPPENMPHPPQPQQQDLRSHYGQFTLAQQQHQQAQLAHHLAQQQMMGHMAPPNHPPPPQYQTSQYQASQPQPPPPQQTQQQQPRSSSPPLPPPPSSVQDDHVNFGQPQAVRGGGIVPRDQDLPGWVPKNYIEKVIAIYDYYADKEDELSFQESAVIYVLKKNDDGWWEGVMDGITGLFPGNYVEPCV
uniref:Abl interactor 2 n=2 Tax=Cacopsylla melanoneura TaxID=428564 RepID=A0A8D9BS77_9HEMI